MDYSLTTFADEAARGANKADPYQLNCRNGVLSLRGGVASPGGWDDLLSYSSPVEYHPEATSDLWENFLQDTTGGDRELAAFLRRACGYSLTGSVKERVLFYIYGPGATGKSAFIETFKAVLGGYAVAVDTEALVFDSRAVISRRKPGGPMLAHLEGRRLAIAPARERGLKLSAKLVKQLTSGALVSARQPYCKPREFKLNCKFWFNGNFKPAIDSDDTARRILQIPFENVISEGSRNTKLKAELRKPEHLQAVLAWAVRGCLEWQSDGLKPPDLLQEQEP